jgi:cellobiose epimerase
MNFGILDWEILKLMIPERLMQYKKEVTDELFSVLAYWEEYAVDKENGGFYGSISNDNIPDATAPKGIVLNSRILWAFSAAAIYTREERYSELATRAFNYISRHFTDNEYGGVFWSVDNTGKVHDDRKQIYGLAFCIYGLSEYYRLTGNSMALHTAKQLFSQVEEHSVDRQKGGYIEALTRDWKPLQDLRLSEKDDNEKKTMNTHLHIVEAYANLYRVWPDKKLRERIINLLELFGTYIINKETNHLNLFMDEDWKVKSTLQSYGHDIEAAWLLQECAEIVECKLYVDQFKATGVMLADAAAEGLDSDGGLWYEYEPANCQLVKEKHSWPQAEAMVGFFNAWQVTGEKKYLDHSIRSWEFTRHHIKDHEKGEWYWGVYEDYRIMEKDKAGFWKCPYHNSRACLEIIKRIEKNGN